MGFVKSIFRVAISPIEVATKTIIGVLDFDDMDDELTGLDIGTFGVARIVRKGALAVKDTANGIVRGINE